jgi:hypothetical protein
MNCLAELPRLQQRAALGTCGKSRDDALDVGAVPLADLVGPLKERARIVGNGNRVPGAHTLGKQR